MLEIARTTNPIFRNFPAPPPESEALESAGRMTFAGALRKTIILALWTGVCAVWIWKALCEPPPPQPYQKSLFLILMVFSALAPFALVGLSLWRKTLSPFMAPLYAMLQGVFFGFSAVALERRSPGLVMQILCLTFCICVSLAYAYRFRLICAAHTFNRKLAAGLGGGAFYVGAALLLPALGIKIFPLILYGPGAAFSGLVVIVAAVTFISGYEMASRSAEQVYPAYMEWHVAFGLIISMIWLYLEGLRLFIRGRIPNESQQA